MDNFYRGKRSHLPAGVRVYEADICDREAIINIFGEERPHVVNHHAALVSVRESYERPERYWEVNFKGTQNVVEAVQRANIQKLIFASSGGAIYGHSNGMPISEEMPRTPLSPYGESKLAAEESLHRLDDRTEAVIFRYSNVYGPGQDPRYHNGVIAIFADALLNKLPPKIFGDGHQTRDYIHVRDVVTSNLTAVNSGVKGIFNIGTGQGHTLRQVFRKISEMMGVEDISPTYLPANDFEVLHNVLDIARARAELKWEPMVSFDHGISETLDAIVEYAPDNLKA